MTGGLARRLADLAGAANVIDDPADRTYFAHDIAGPAAYPAHLVVRPPTVEAAATCVAAITDAGYAVKARGGGHSYTGGYGPESPQTVVLDLGGLDRVLEINQADGWVAVEAGCSWSRLYDALAAVGRRTPFFGPLSGFVSTVGGAASQNAAFFGSTCHGPMSRSVLGLDVATADGRVLRIGATGSGFARDFGPDAVGLFLGDCGALGVKLRVAMRILPMPVAVRYGSFAFESFEAVLDAQLALGDMEGISECFGFDSGTHDNLRRVGFSLAEGAAALRDVARAEGGARGIAAAVATAAGRRAVDDAHNSLHVVVESASDAAADAASAEVAARAARHGGVAIADTIPRVMRARPFRPLKSLLGPEGEAWLPVHGLLPPARVQGAVRAARGVLEARRAEMSMHRIRTAWLSALVGGRVLVEPQFFWFDALSPFHLRNVTPAQRTRYARRAPDEDARALVHALRRALAETLAEHGATHYQIGAYYPYLARIDPGQRALLEAVKGALDPKGLMSPGALGL